MRTDRQKIVGLASNRQYVRHIQLVSTRYATVRRAFQSMAMIALVMLAASPSHAESMSKEVKKLIKLERKIRKLSNQAARGYQKLTTEQQQSLLFNFDGGSSFAEDIDNDSIPDVFESDDNLCSSDSDGDGILDGDDASPNEGVVIGDGNEGNDSFIPGPLTYYDGSILLITSEFIAVGLSELGGGQSVFRLDRTEYYRCGGRTDRTPCALVDFSIADRVRVYAYERDGEFIAHTILGSKA
jgi:hypothetical protein